MRPVPLHPVPAGACSGSEPLRMGRLGILPTEALGPSPPSTLILGYPGPLLEAGPTAFSPLLSPAQPSPMRARTSASSLDTSSQFINKISTSCQSLSMFMLGPLLPRPRNHSFLHSTSQYILRISHSAPPQRNSCGDGPTVRPRSPDRKHAVLEPPPCLTSPPGWQPQSVASAKNRPGVTG